MAGKEITKWKVERGTGGENKGIQKESREIVDFTGGKGKEMEHYDEGEIPLSKESRKSMIRGNL